VSADNAYGDIRVRGSFDDEVFVLAVIQKIGTEADEFEVDVSAGEEGQDLTILVRQLVSDPGGRVDVSMRVPHGLRLRVATTDGQAQVKRYQGDVAVRTRGGKISLGLPGRVLAETDTGHISAGLAGGLGEAPDGPWEFRSGEGDIEVRVAAGADADLDVSAGGGIVNRWPADALSDLKSGERELTGKLGRGGTPLRIDTAGGRVFVGPL